MLALDLNGAVANRPAAAAKTLQFRSERSERFVTERQAGDDRHCLARTTLRLPAHTHCAGIGSQRPAAGTLARALGHRAAAAGADGSYSRAVDDTHAVTVRQIRPTLKRGSEPS